jgi:hypothetical protein
MLAVGSTNRLGRVAPAVPQLPADMAALRDATLNRGGLSLIWRRGLEIAAIGKDVNIRVPLEGHPDQRVLITLKGARRALSTDEMNSVAGYFSWGASAQSQLPEPQIELMRQIAGRLFVMAGNT